MVTLRHGTADRCIRRLRWAEYFSTADIPILSGREIEPQDEGNAPLVGVINQTMARTFFGDTKSDWRQIQSQCAVGVLDFTVVGIVADSETRRPRTPSAVGSIRRFSTRRASQTSLGPPMKFVSLQSRRPSRQRFA